MNACRRRCISLVNDKTRNANADNENGDEGENALLWREVSLVDRPEGEEIKTHKEDAEGD